MPASNAIIASDRTAARILLDPGWLFLLAGLGLIAAAVLVPAGDALDEARWQRDRAHVVEQHREQRLARHAQYLAALERGDEPLIRSLVATQLNLTEPGRMLLTRSSSLPEASVFPGIEPESPILPGRAAPRSALRRIMADPTTRLWAAALGVLSVVIGLLPPTRRSVPAA